MKTQHSQNYIIQKKKKKKKRDYSIMQPNYYALGNQKFHDLLYCEDSTSPMQGTQVHSLVVELKFHMPHGTAKK